MTALPAAAAATGGVVAPKPWLKWAGGKRQLLPELRKYMPIDDAGHYYEPFIGGGAVFFDLRARGFEGHATLGDANERLVRAYLGVRNDVEAVIETLRGSRYDKREYLRERARKVDGLEDDEVAAWLIYLNKTGFNGLYRVNRAGQFNVPFGRYDNPTICDTEGLRAASGALRKTEMRIGDFEKTVRGAEQRDLVYFDPPYCPVSDTANFVGYAKDGFDMADQERLRDCAVRMKQRGVHVVLSNADVPAVRKLYAKGFKLHSVSARRSINSDKSARGPVGELIIT